MLVWTTFPFENPSEDPTADDWILGPAAAIVILGVVILVAVIAQRAALIVIAVAAQLAVGSAVFALAVHESQHSDGKVTLFALACALTAAAAATNAFERR
jgi:hypothetical protein